MIFFSFWWIFRLFWKKFFTNNVLMTFSMSSCALAKWTAFLKQGSFSEPQNKEGNWNNYFLTFLWEVFEKHHSRCINEKLIHFIQWCLRILGLNSLHKRLRKLLGYSLGARLLWVCTISIFLDTDSTRHALPSGYTNYTHTNNVSGPLFHGVANKRNSHIFKVFITLKGVK